MTSGLLNCLIGLFERVIQRLFTDTVKVFNDPTSRYSYVRIRPSSDWFDLCCVARTISYLRLFLTPMAVNNRIRRICDCKAAATRGNGKSFQQPADKLAGLGLVNLLPLWGEEAVAVLLGTADIAQLFCGRRVVDVAVGVAGHEGEVMRRCLLDVEADADGQLAGEGRQHKVANTQLFMSI